MSCKKIISVLISLSLILCFTGCMQNTDNQNTTQSNTSQGNTDTSTEKNDSNTQNTENDTTSQSGTTEISAEQSDYFTTRDIESGWDEALCSVITLTNSGISSADQSVNISGLTATITAEGVYVIRGECTNGSIIVDAPDTAKLQIVLDSVNITSESSAPIYVKQADKVFLTLSQGSVNTLSAAGEFVAIDENNIDSCIFSKDDITINGTGSLNINSTYGHGIVSKDSLVITGGAISITASKHALSANDDIRVLTTELNITAEKDGFNCENDDTESYIYIAGGKININCGDDGLHAGAALIVNGGTINITKSYEGLEGQTIEINGGIINVTSSDDGLNAAGGNDQSGFGMFNDMFSSDQNADITINGGELTINADGDGIDSNGTLNLTGGTVYVWGPVNSANGALDYGSNAAISNAIIVAAGASGMAQNFTSSNTQCSALISLSGSANTELKLTDSNGNILISCTPAKSYDCVLVSCPELYANCEYTLTSGTATSSFTPTSNTYSQTGSGGFGGGNPGGFGSGGRKNQTPGSQSSGNATGISY